MMLAFAMGAALAAPLSQQARPVAVSDFDLSAEIQQFAPPQEPEPLVPEQPRNLDTRDFAIDAPEAEWRVAEGGPVLVVGAMGGRRAGMPKLAHVGLDWSF